MKWLHAIIAILFFVFAIVQYNDADAWQWMFIYGFVAILSVLAFFRRHIIPLLIVGFVLVILAMLSRVSGFMEWLSSGGNILNEMSPEKPYIEEVREFLGLLLALFALGFQYYSGKIRTV